MISLHSMDGGVDNFDAGAVLFGGAVADAFDGLLAGFGVADDAAFADVFAASFKLRLDEDDGFALPFFLELVLSAARIAGRTRVAEMKETSIAKKTGVGCSGVGSSPGLRRPGVGAFAQDDAGIVAELLGRSGRLAGVDGEDGSCAMLQRAVGEAAGRGADVETRARPVRSMDQWVRACTSLRPPRLTYLRTEPSRRTTASAETEAPGLSTRCWLTRTRPARMRA